MATERNRSARSENDKIFELLSKTVENGATPSEEVAAVQLAHMLVRQRDLDMEVFKAGLALIGDPPRYLVTSDGFLVPTKVIGSSAAPPPGGHGYGSAGGHGYGYGHGHSHPRRRRDDFPQHGAHNAERCPISPTGRHRMERFMRGTRDTGQKYCLHCGYRTDS